jgi:hypothetical protein
VAAQVVVVAAEVAAAWREAEGNPRPPVAVLVVRALELGAVGLGAVGLGAAVSAEED